jgi:ribosomal protein L16/L10AE
MKFLKKYPKEITVKVSKKYTKRLIKINSITKSDKNVMLPRGVFALRVLQNCLLQHKQLENIRRLFLPLTRKTAKVWYNGNFTIPVTKKAAGNRMGKGKGKLDA